MFETELTKLLGIDYPILQGGMAWAATAELAAAVSKAGGLGIIGAGNAPGTWVRQEIYKVRQETDRPFGVNVMVKSPLVEEVIQVLAEERVPVVTTGGGNPGKFLARLKQSGSLVFPVVSSVALAKRLAGAGVDGLIAEGMESGGHIGKVTTMVLVPQVVDAVRIPVIAAGGIADGRGMAAALALGAVGVQMGTRFLCSQECIVHPAVKQAILKANERDTVVTGSLTGHPVRVLYNDLARRFEALEAERADTAQIAALGVGKLKAAMLDGDTRWGSVMAGQIAGMLRDLPTAAEILVKTSNEAQKVCARLQNYA